MRFNQSCSRCASPFTNGDEILEYNDGICHKECKEITSDIQIVDDYDESLEQVSKYLGFSKLGLKSNSDSYSIYKSDID